MLPGAQVASMGGIITNDDPMLSEAEEVMARCG